MKKLFLAAILALAAATSFAQEKKETGILRFNYEMEIGWLPGNEWIIHTTRYTGQGLDFYATMKAEVVLEVLNPFLFFVGGSMQVDMSALTYEGLPSFSPSEMYYGLNAGIRLGGLEIGFRHFCYHPVMPFLALDGSGDVMFEGGYNQLYISFKGSVLLF